MNPVRKSLQQSNSNHPQSKKKINHTKKFSNGVNFTTTAAATDQRLDKFLTENLPDKTRSQIQKMIKLGLVEVNGQPAKVHQFLKPGQKITVKNKLPSSAKPTTAPIKPEKILAPVIMFETADYLVINKPVGLLVHPTEKQETQTLVSWLLKKYPQIKKLKGDIDRAGIVHRLDRDVSGVMVIAKTQVAFNHLKSQFKNRLVKKEYLALVYGRIDKLTGEIDLPIGRNKAGQFVAHPKKGYEKFAASDKLAKTKYQVLEYLKDYSLVRVEILTGRTHQIRAHLFAIGHPILGDRIYKPKKELFTLLRRKIKQVNPGRIFLHSEKLSFVDQAGVPQTFATKLPQTLTDFLNEHRPK